jgi:hypothetical protein
MTPPSASDVEFEIGHVLFMDIVGYSKLVIDKQTELSRKLNEIARNSEQFRRAESDRTLVRLPTGDGMALVFRSNVEAPTQCALEISKALQSHPEIKVRMGIHSGPVNETADVNNRANIAGVLPLGRFRKAAGRPLRLWPRDSSLRARGRPAGLNFLPG